MTRLVRLVQSALMRDAALAIIDETLAETGQTPVMPEIEGTLFIHHCDVPKRQTKSIPPTETKEDIRWRTVSTRLTRRAAKHRHSSGLCP